MIVEVVPERLAPESSMLASPNRWAAAGAPAASPSKQDCAAAKAAASAAFTAVLRVESSEPRSNTRTSIPAKASRAKATISRTAPPSSSWTRRSLRKVSESIRVLLLVFRVEVEAQVGARSGEQQTEGRDRDEQPPPLGNHQTGGDDRASRELRGGPVGDGRETSPDVCGNPTKHSNAPLSSQGDYAVRSVRPSP